MGFLFPPAIHETPSIQIHNLFQERSPIKSAPILISLLLSTIASAHITDLQDNRYAYATVTLNNGPGTPQTEDRIERFYSNPFQTLNEAFDLSITDPAVGYALASTAYESSLSTTQLSSSASISSNITTLPTGLVAGFANRVEFTLDDTTTFQIEGTISGFGTTGGSTALFGSIANDGESSETFFSESAFDTTRKLNTILTLEAGDYYFTTLSFTSSATLDYDQSVSPPSPPTTSPSPSSPPPPAPPSSSSAQPSLPAEAANFPSYRLPRASGGGGCEADGGGLHSP